MTPLLPKIISQNQSTLPLVFQIPSCSGLRLATYSIAFNGTLIGYFKGEKGLRQGDPLSPILFVLVMNILSKLLNTAAAKGIFNFHPKCKRTCLTHLTFADDLLIFCKGNLESIMGVTSVLDYFYEISVRYLGIPLVMRKLIVKDCQPLIDKVKLKLHQWSRLKLSYSGRLVLIKTVLFSMANYWCRQLILPQSVINKIEQICSRYFWKGSDIPAVGARVSWDRICKPKSKGGLGLKDIKSWNKSCMMLLIRRLLIGEGSFWVAWIQSYYFKDRDF
ncbi:uncharacterized protein LOC120174810 [Hibiscus syriacus]|uniref:uncharacterized protein LOC120174810 n=1 Tax=Hibiscus syriacus TaxID=106335 RepID=UPI0019215372|nr:uncharacterized protein LOC120174810 [Hibiscus syriacus]